MKKLFVISLLAVLIGGCSLNDENKLPPTWHYPANKFHAYIWRTDSMNSDAKPLDAMITVSHDSITDIESWDGLKKTQKDIFKPIKVSWDQLGGNSEFKMYGISYTVQLIEQYDGTYECPGNFRTPKREKK